MGGRSHAHATRRDANHDARNDAHGRGRGDTHGAHRQRGARARSTAAAVRGESRRGGGHLGIDVGARIPRATRAITRISPAAVPSSGAGGFINPSSFLQRSATWLLSRVGTADSSAARVAERFREESGINLARRLPPMRIQYLIINTSTAPAGAAARELRRPARAHCRSRDARPGRRRLASDCGSDDRTYMIYYIL